MEFYYTAIHPNLTLLNYKKESYEQFFFERRYESIKEIMDENRLLTVFDLYFFEMFKYLFAIGQKKWFSVLGLLRKK